jgi:hypothetical protein
VRTSPPASSCPRSTASVDLRRASRIDHAGVSPVTRSSPCAGLESDTIEIETIFTRAGAGLGRGRGMPPRPERYERVGIDVRAILNGQTDGARRRPGLRRRHPPGVARLGCSPDTARATTHACRAARPARPRRSGGHLTEGVLAVCVGLATVVGLAIQVLSHTRRSALAFAVIAGYLPIAALAGRARRRQRELAEVWPEAVDNLASAVRAGMSLPEALGQLSARGRSRCGRRSRRSPPTTRSRTLRRQSRPAQAAAVRPVG